MESSYQCDNKQRAYDSQFDQDIDSFVAHLFDDLLDAAHEDAERPLLNAGPPPAAPATRPPDTHFVPATEAQKLLLTLSTTNRCLNEHPQSKVLVALASTSIVREYTRHLQLRCVAHARIQHLGDPRTSVGNPNVVIGTIDALANAITNNVVALRWFHILFMDHSFAHDATSASAQLVALQWNLLKESERPRFIDLVSNGQPPPPTADVPAQSKRPAPLAMELIPPSPERQRDQLRRSGALELRSDGPSALLGELKHKPAEAISPTLVSNRQLNMFLTHLRTIDWDTGATMGIFVQDKGFAAPLLRMIHERLEWPVAVQAPGHLRRASQIVVFPNPRDAEIPQYDIIVTIDRTGAIHMIQAMPHGEWSRVEFHVPAPREAQVPPPPPTNAQVAGEGARDRYMPYPYQHTSGTEINIFNCMSIFLTYCRALLGPQVDEDQLFQHTWDKAHRVDVLCSVTYPSPKGPVKLSKGQVHAAWAGRTLHDLCGAEHGIGMPRSDLQQCWFCYVAVMDIIRCGYLDCYNNVTARALPLNKDPKSFLNELQQRLPNLVLSYETVSQKSHAASFQSEVCLQYNGKVFKFTGEVCNNKRYAEKTAALAAVLFITGGSPTAQAADLNLKQQMSALALSVPSTLKKRGVDPELTLDYVGNARAGKTAKMLLNELMQSMSRAATGKPPILYTCQPVEDAWQATVHITRAGDARSFVGDVAFTKKASEESAALKALNELTSKPLRTGKGGR